MTYLLKILAGAALLMAFSTLYEFQTRDTKLLPEASKVISPMSTEEYAKYIRCKVLTLTALEGYSLQDVSILCGEATTRRAILLQVKRLLLHTEETPNDSD